MKSHKTSLLLSITALAAMVEVANGAPPPNVVDSDASGNTAMGTVALESLTSGVQNTASGYATLPNNTTGSYNSAFGFQAMFWNTTGSFNSASGAYALVNNTTASENSAHGYGALFANQTGNANTALGTFALYQNSTGDNNTASGSRALVGNTTGSSNVALGNNALRTNANGHRNVAVGYGALFNNVAGKSNTAIGWYAGRGTTGHDNVLVAHKGVADESQTMRLGTKGTPDVVSSGITRTFIAGVRGVTTELPGVPVVIDAKGQLGTISSSRRYKQDIQTLTEASDRLYQLRPVQFRYQQSNAGGQQAIQYGLIAEEVAEVYPELVVRDEQGQPETVAYHLLPALLLNELQREHQLNQQQAAQLASQATQLAELSELKQQLAEMKELLAALQPQPKVLQVAQH